MKLTVEHIFDSKTTMEPGPFNDTFGNNLPTYRIINYKVCSIIRIESDDNQNRQELPFLLNITLPNLERAIDKILKEEDNPNNLSFYNAFLALLNSVARDEGKNIFPFEADNVFDSNWIMQQQERIRSKI